MWRLILWSPSRGMTPFEGRCPITLAQRRWPGQRFPNTGRAIRILEAKGDRTRAVIVRKR